MNTSARDHALAMLQPKAMQRVSLGAHVAGAGAFLGIGIFGLARDAPHLLLVGCAMFLILASRVVRIRDGGAALVVSALGSMLMGAAVAVGPGFRVFGGAFLALLCVVAPLVVLRWRRLTNP